MSLVHDALQKAEREKRRKSPSGVIQSTVASNPAPPPQPFGAASVAIPAVASTSAAPAPEAQRSHSAVYSVLIFCISIVAMVAIVLVVVNAPWLREPVKTIAPQTEEANTKAAVAAAPAVTEPAAASTPAADSRYRITGITIDPDGKPWAIINGQLRTVDQYVDGAIVKKIERDRVTLDVEGRNLVVRLF